MRNNLPDEEKLRHGLLAVALCMHPDFGISKCIEANREIYSLLQCHVPELFAMGRCPWIAGWLESQDIFLVNLSHAVGFPVSPWRLGDDHCSWYGPVVEEAWHILEAVLVLCDGSCARIFKRIDESRQLFETLLMQCPDLLDAHSGIEMGIVRMDIFFNDIAHALKLKQQIRISDADYPRPWPGTADTANRYRKEVLQQMLLRPQTTESSK